MDNGGKEGWRENVSRREREGRNKGGKEEERGAYLGSRSNMR